MAITFNIAAFRVAFPQFENETLYPDATLQGYWDSAICIISDNSNCTVLIKTETCRERAINLMTAHIGALADSQARGAQPGFINSASVDKVSVSLEAPPTKTAFQAWLNQTAYGQQLRALLSAASVGGLYIGGANERGSFRRVGGIFGN